MWFGRLTALCGIVLLAVVGIVGCSDDETTAPPSVTYGSLDDPQFVPIKAQIDDALTNFVGDVVAGFDNLYVRPGDTASVRADLTPPSTVPDPNADPDILVVLYQNGWHFVYATYTGDVYQSRLADSIQYQIDGTPVEEPSGSVDYIHFITNWTFTALDPNVSHINYTGRTEFELANLDLNAAVVNGAAARTLEVAYIANDTTMNNVFSFNGTVENLTVPKAELGWSSGCPISGTIDMTLAHVFSWSNGATFGVGGRNWTIAVTFDDGTATVTADNGETTWRYTGQVCDPPVK
jgi:hypothetical protein